MNKFEFKNLTPFKWFVLENFPFIEADFDALTEWQLFCKLGKEMNKIINSENTLGTQMENITNAFIELQNYVNNYFDNLDVQEEINNKLNEMASDGTLQQLINFFIQSNCPLIFETVEDMLNSDIIIDGSYCKTLGYYSKNDGGAGLYQIVYDDLEENAFNLKIDTNKYAVLLTTTNTLNLSQLGLSSNNNASKNSSIIYQAFYKLKDGGTIILPDGEFSINPIIFDFQILHLNFRSNSRNGSTLSCNNEDYIFTFNQKVDDCKFEFLRLLCNNIASGFNFNSQNKTVSFGLIEINNVYVSNAHKGYNLENVTYFRANKMTCSITGNANTDDFAVNLDGYEYNYFNECSFNYYGNTPYTELNLFRIINTSWVYIQNCEFAHCGGNMLLLDGNHNNHVSYIWIQNNIFFRFTKNAIQLFNGSKKTSDIHITDNIFTQKGDSTNETAIYITGISSDSDTIIITNNVFGKEGNNNGKILVADSNRVYNGLCFTNNGNRIKNNLLGLFELNNNKFDEFNILDTPSNGILEITGDGIQTEFNLILHDYDTVYIPERIPLLLINFIENNIPNYKISNCYYDSSNRLRTKVTFDTPLSAGQHSYRYKVIY